MSPRKAPLIESIYIVALALRGRFLDPKGCSAPLRAHLFLARHGPGYGREKAVGVQPFGLVGMKLFQRPVNPVNIENMVPQESCGIGHKAHNQPLPTRETLQLLEFPVVPGGDAQQCPFAEQLLRAFSSFAARTKCGGSASSRTASSVMLRSSPQRRPVVAAVQ